MSEEKNTPKIAVEVEAVRPDHTAEILDLIRGNDSPKVMRQNPEDYSENDISEVIERLSTRSTIQSSRA